MTHRRTIAALAVLLALVVTGLVPPADDAGAGTGDDKLVLGEFSALRDRDPAPPGFARFEGSLGRLADRTARGPLADRMAAAAEVVDVMIGASTGSGRSVEARLRALGAAQAVQIGDTVHATITGGVLASIASDPNILWVQSALEPVPLAIEGQGVGSIGADDWHAVGLTGAGVKVAIIDLGFKGYTALLGTELPNTVTYQNFGCHANLSQQSDHGTGAAEIVHEVAPGAELFLLCIDNGNDLAQAVNYAVAHGVDVVNHSVGWFNAGRGDGTGPIGAIVDTALAADIVWVNSAGNHAQRHWMGTFSDPNTNQLHNFTVDDESIAVQLGPAQGITVSLRWDDWPVSTTNDFDLYLLRQSDSAVVAGSENHQVPFGHPPVESFQYVNPGPAGTFHILIRRFSATATPSMDLFVHFSSPGQPAIQHNIPARSVVEPATKPTVVAVGAVCWSNGNIRIYSSRGPNIDGIVRPDLAGPDGVSSATYGTTGTCNGGFTGTSAASPHVAGAAALVAQAHPAATQADLKALLTGLTIDAGSPGLDNAYGHGILALGDPLVGFHTQPTVGLVDPTQGRWHLRNSAGQVTSFYFGNPGDVPFMGDWNCDGIDTPGMYRQSDGFVYLRNTNTQGIANITFFFGNPGDVPITGDFNGNGCDTVSIYRPSNQTFYIINALGQDGGGLGAATTSYVFGNPGDKPFTGDFNGNGITTVGLHRESTGLVYFRNTHTQGNADAQFFFGDPGDRFVAGDWNGNGIDSPGVFRPGNTTFYFRFTNTQGNADAQFTWGQSGWLPVTGRFGLG